MQFKDVIGQKHVKQHLVEMVQQNRLSHALLFLGKEGCGALATAIAFAQFITCTSNRPSPQVDKAISLFTTDKSEILNLKSEISDDSCGTCPSCTKAHQLIHPDIHFSFPVITKKAGSPPLSCDFFAEWREFVKKHLYGNVYDWLQFIGADNKQGNITAQECNDIMRKLNLKSFESGYKILILWMPEYLGKEGNKLLKLIEEPPDNTLFILVAENESAILPTILSRCQLIKFQSIENNEIQETLVNNENCTPEQAKQIANMSEGNYREALHLLQHADENFYNLLREWLNSILKYQLVNQGKFIDEMARLGREKQKQFLRYFTHLLEHALRFNVLTDSNKQDLLQSISTAEQEFISRLNKSITLEQQQAIAEELDKAAYYIERNANPKLLFHSLSIKIFHIVKNNVVIAV
jgi:DNA polymerase-3 subunit delta'